MSKKKKQRRSHGSLLLPILVCILPLLILAILGFAFLKGYPQEISEYRREARQLVEDSDRSSFAPSQLGSIYDKDEKLISEISSDKFASYVKYEDIPENFVNVMVCTEDKKFFKHSGVDYLALVRATISYLSHNGSITQGGSTITMQLAKLVFLSSSQTLSRKIEQAFIAQYLEKKYSKEEIMEFYLNNVYFANGYYGIQAAARGYFNSDLKDLSLSQTAFLCAIPNSPSYYDPLVNMDNTITRRNLMLKNLLSEKKITQEEYVAAATEDMVLSPAGSEDYAGTHNYVDTYAIHCATRALMESEGFRFKYDFSSDSERKKYEDEYADAYESAGAKISSGKYELYTSIDMELQEKMQKAIDQNLNNFFGMSTDGEYVLQGAGVCIDNETGYVVAEVGGRSNANFSVYTLNRVFQSYRQPGSTIKPLSVYTPVFDMGMYTPSDYVSDHYIEGGPKNAGGGYYGGVSIRTAVELSLNTVAWQLYEEIGPATGLAYLKKMHFSKIVDQDDTLATSLGGFTEGVTPAELTSGYATLANGGMYREPTCIVKILDYEGNEVYKSDQSEERIYSEDAAETMTDVLKGVITRGTGAGLALDGDMDAAGKTGTTDDTKDGWFVGYTHYYTTGIWVGCNTPQEVEDLHGSTYPGEIWQEFMNAAHENLPYEPLE